MTGARKKLMFNGQENTGGCHSRNFCNSSTSLSLGDTKNSKDISFESDEDCSINTETNQSMDSGNFSLSPPAMNNIENNPKEAIRNSFIYLKHNIQHEPLLLQLTNSLNPNEYNNVMCCKTDLQKCETLLKTVIRKGSNVCSGFIALLQHQDFSHIYEKVRDDYNARQGNHMAGFPLNFSLQKEHLRRHRIPLINEIDPQLISDHLFQDGTITIDSHDEVAAHETTRQKSICLLRELQNGSQQDLDNFWRACQITKADGILLTAFRSSQRTSGLENNCVCVRLSFRNLADRVSVEIMLEHIYGGEFLTDHQYQTIRSEDHQTKKVRNLIKRCLDYGEKACEHMISGIKHEQYIFNAVKSKLEERLNQERRQIQFSYSFDSLRNRIKLFQEEIEQSDELADILLEENEFTTKDHDEIAEANRRSAKCRLLLNKVFIGQNRPAETFIYALEEVKFPLAEIMSQPPSSGDGLGGLVQITCEKGVVSTNVSGFLPDCCIDVHIEIEGNNNHIINQQLFVAGKRHEFSFEKPFAEETAMEVDEVDTGSVIIHLHPITDDAVQNFLDQKENAIQKVLSAILDQAGFKELLAGNETVVKVQAKGIDRGKKAHFADDQPSLKKKEIIINNWEFLLDELEIQQMIPMFIKRKCFQEDKVKSVLEDVSGRRNVTEQFLIWMVHGTSDEVVDHFFDILKELDNTFVLDKLFPVKDKKLHEKAEKIRKGILENYSILLDELGSIIIKDTLKQCRDVTEIVKNSTSAAGGKRRKNRVHEFLKFILRKDENVLEFQKVMELVNLVELLETKSTSEATSVPESSLQMLDLKEGILFECSFRVTVVPDADQPDDIEEGKKMEKQLVKEDAKLKKGYASGFDEPFKRGMEQLAISPSEEREMRQREEPGLEKQKTKSEGKGYGLPKPQQQWEKEHHKEVYSPKPSGSKEPVKSQSTAEVKVVAAIDFGTTYSGFAFSKREEPDKVITNRWTSKTEAHLMSDKTPTAILFDLDGKFDSFGFEAEHKYAQLADDNEQEGWSFFRKFKMRLHMCENLSLDTVLEDSQGRTKKAREVFTESIKYLKGKVESSLHTKYAEVTSDEILWVITVPAIWQEPSKQFMRVAAELAGIRGDRLMFALEPEAAAIFAKENKTEKEEGNLRSYNPGKKFIVVDVGGGTADYTVMEVQDDHSLGELYKTNGGDWGGDTINQMFWNFFDREFGEHVVNEFKRENPSEALQLEVDIETQKRGIDEKQEITLNLPFPLIQTVQSRHGGDWMEQVRDPMVKARKGGKLKFSVKKLEEMFMETVGKIVERTGEILSSKDSKGIEDIILVGGFSASSILQQKMKETFKSNRFVILGDLAVLKGAVMFGHDPEIISSRICPYTYGVECIRYFLKGDREDKRIVIQGQPHSKHVFETLACRGESIKIDEKRNTLRLPSRSKITKMEVKVYRTDRSESPKYVTDPECTFVGKVIVEMPNLKHDLDREVEVSLLFGKTELVVQGKDVNTGEVYETGLDLFAK